MYWNPRLEYNRPMCMCVCVCVVKKLCLLYFRRTSPRPGSLWEATHVLSDKQHNSWGTSRSHCCHRRALMDSALKDWRGPSRLWPHCSSSSRPTWSSSRARFHCILTCPPRRWSSSRRTCSASSWWGCPLSRQKATYDWSVSPGNRLTDEQTLDYRPCL